MAAALALQPRDATRDDRAAGDERRTWVLFRCRDRSGHRFDVVALDLDHVPVRNTEAVGDVFADRQVGAAVVGDAVVVPEQHQLGQPLMTGERDHLLPYAFLEAAVSIMVDQPVAEASVEVRLGDRHPEGARDALAERSCGEIDAMGRIEFRMAFAMRSELAEALNLVERDGLIAREVEQREQQHRTMAVRQDEAVAVRPGGIGRIELQVAREERRGDFCHAERNTLMAFRGADDGVDGKKPDRIRERREFVWGHSEHLLSA